MPPKYLPFIMNIYHAKKDLETFSQQEIDQLASHLHIDAAGNDLLWLIAINIHRGRSTLESAYSLPAEWYRKMYHHSTIIGDSTFPGILYPEDLVDKVSVVENVAELADLPEWPIFKDYAEAMNIPGAPVEWVARSYIFGAIGPFENISHLRDAVEKYYDLLSINPEWPQSISELCGLTGCDQKPGLEEILATAATRPALQLPQLGTRDPSKILDRRYQKYFGKKGPILCNVTLGLDPEVYVNILREMYEDFGEITLNRYGVPIIHLRAFEKDGRLNARALYNYVRDTCAKVQVGLQIEHKVKKWLSEIPVSHGRHFDKREIGEIVAFAVRNNLLKVSVEQIIAKKQEMDISKKMRIEEEQSRNRFYEQLPHSIQGRKCISKCQQDNSGCWCYVVPYTYYGMEYDWDYCNDTDCGTF